MVFCRCRILFLTLQVSCVGNLEFHFGSSSLQRWLERQSSKPTFRFAMLYFLSYPIYGCTGSKFFPNFCVFIFIWLSAALSMLFLLLQTAFIISVCNHQLLDFIENEIIRLLSFVPGLATVLPKLVAKLQIIRNKYMAPTPTVSNVAVRCLTEPEYIFSYVGCHCDLASVSKHRVWF